MLAAWTEGRDGGNNISFLGSNKNVEKSEDELACARYHIASDGESAKVFVEAIIISFHFILVHIEFSVRCALCPLMTV